MAYNIEKNMYDGYIYCIENLINGKKYIGQTTKTIDARWTQHKSSANADIPKYYIHKAIKKYGIENFVVYEISKISCTDKKDLKNHLDYMEKFYIKQYNTMFDESGYNLTHGGDAQSELVYKKIYQYDVDGILLKKWDCLQHAAECYGVSKESIWAACNGKSQTCSAYVWRYEGDSFYKFPIKQSARSHKIYSQKVIQYDSSGNFIKSYTKNELDNLYCNSGVYYIYKVCDGKKVHYKNYIWRYDGDCFDKYITSKSKTGVGRPKKKQTQTEKTDRAHDGRFKSKKVNCYDKNENFIKTYNSLTEAGCDVGLKNSYNITNVCKCKRNFAAGYKWYFADDPTQPDHTKIIIG